MCTTCRLGSATVRVSFLSAPLSLPFPFSASCHSLFNRPSTADFRNVIKRHGPVLESLVVKPHEDNTRFGMATFVDTSSVSAILETPLEWEGVRVRRCGRRIVSP